MTSVTSLSGYSYSTSYKSSLDKNGDGVVSADELAAASQTGSGSSTSSSNVVSTAGSTGETAGSSALDRLSSLVSSILLQITSGESTPPAGDQDGFFTSLDTGGDGTLTAEEFSAGKPEDVSDEQSASLFSRLDADGDGVLSTEEFAAMRPEGPPPPPPGGSATAESGETDLTDLLAQLKSVLETYLEDTGENAAENAVLLTA